MLVTNQLQFTKEADLIVYIADGKVEESGTYAELMAADAGYAKLMSQAEVCAALYVMSECHLTLASEHRCGSSISDPAPRGAAQPRVVCLSTIGVILFVATGACPRGDVQSKRIEQGCN